MTLLVSAALAALLAGAQPNYDTVYLQNGGRVRGTIVEEDPVRGVSVQIPGGALRTVAPADVARVEYGDGTVGTIGTPPRPGDPLPPIAPAPGTPAPPSTAAPPAEPAPLPPVEPLPPPREPARPPGAPVPPPVAVGPMIPAGPSEGRTVLGQIMVAASLSYLQPGGSAEAGLRMEDFTDTMVGLGLEGAWRLDPHLLVGAYLDLGFGTAGPVLDAWCRYHRLECETGDVRLGVMARYAFTPLSRHTPWVGVGTGVDVLFSSSTDSETTPGYSGYEPLRLSAGWDYRGDGQIGYGIFVTAGWGRYDEVDNATGSYDAVESKRQHTWLQIGARGVIFP